LSQLGERARFAMVEDGEPIAVGIGVVEEGWLGLFSLATAKHARRRGIASAIVDVLEGWAGACGACATYLQVERDNVPALAFYEPRGFRVAHSYHYRSAEQSPETSVRPAAAVDPSPTHHPIPGQGAGLACGIVRRRARSTTTADRTV
jgi:ribosomal protein S18 acetylase RimI-like enzyme